MDESKVIVLVSEDTYTPSNEELEEQSYIFCLMEMGHFVVKYGWAKVEADLKALAFRLEDDAKMPYEPTEIGA